MKDWKSDLLAIKVQSPAQDEKIQTARKIEAKPATAQASFIKPLEIEKKILGTIRRIEALTISLSKIAPLPLVKGNSKLIKQHQNEIKLLKEEFATLSYKFKPSLISGSKVPNTNALLIEMKSELLQREDRYQKTLLTELKIEHEKSNKERELKLEEERKEKLRLKELLTKKALSIVKEYDISKCNKCTAGYVTSLCNECFGTQRLSQPRKGLITERFTCGNLKPNCPFCGGLGFGSRQKEGLTYECGKCTNGKQVNLCKSCKGSQLHLGKMSASTLEEMLDGLESDSKLIQEIQEFVGIK